MSADDTKAALEARDRLLERLQVLRDGADALERGEHNLTVDELAKMVADWIRSECAMHGELEPFVELINATISREGVPASSHLRLARTVGGDLQFTADSSEHAERIVKAVMA